MDSAEKIEVGVLVLLLIGGITYVVLKNKKTPVVVPNNNGHPPTHTGNGTPTGGGVIVPPPNPTLDPNKEIFEKQFVLVGLPTAALKNKDLYYVENNELFAISGKMLTFYKSLVKSQKVNPVIFPINSLTDLKSYANNNKIIGKGKLEKLFVDVSPINYADHFYGYTPMPSIFHSANIADVGRDMYTGGGDTITIDPETGLYIVTHKAGKFVMSSKNYIMVG